MLLLIEEERPYLYAIEKLSSSRDGEEGQAAGCEAYPHSRSPSANISLPLIDMGLLLAVAIADRVGHEKY